ncbi:MAG: hypothetical protein WD046_01760 [Paracoccaceae bacterium]
MIGIASTSLTGAAGEHLVMSRLLSRGLIAALAPQGVPNMDIVVTSVDGMQLCAIQVKTRWEKGSDGGWHMGRKHETIVGSNIFYCFVDLGTSVTDLPVVYVLPSETVANVIARTHATWLAGTGKNGHVRKDSNFRRLSPDNSKLLGDDSEFGQNWLAPYREAWDILHDTSNHSATPLIPGGQ